MNGLVRLTRLVVFLWETKVKNDTGLTYSEKSEIIEKWEKKWVEDATRFGFPGILHIDGLIGLKFSFYTHNQFMAGTIIGLRYGDGLPMLQISNPEFAGLPIDCLYPSVKQGKRMWTIKLKVPTDRVQNYEMEEDLYHILGILHID